MTRPETAKLRLTKVWIDEYQGGPYRALIKVDEHWNGWVIPYFRKAEVDQMKADWDRVKQTYPEEDTITWDGLTVVKHSGTYDINGDSLSEGGTPWQDRIEPVTIHGLPHWPVGAREFTWSEYEED